MMRSLFAGVTGLRNHQIRMDVIGNNIANVNTVGYKASRVSFADTLSQTLRGAASPQGTRGGINALQVGLGVNIASIDVIQTQGNMQNTGKLSDVALQGEGFYILSDGGRQYYTRAGNFNLEKDGRLTSPSNGLIVQGWMANNQGVLNVNSPLVPLQLPLGQTIPPIATTTIGFGGNLDTGTNGELVYPSMNVMDQDGNSCTVEIKLTATGFNTFHYEATSTNGVITGGTGDITLDSDGNVIGTGLGFSVKPNGAATATPAVSIQPPALGATNGGNFIGAKPSSDSFEIAGFAGDGTYPPITIYDELGNPMEIQYTLSGGPGFPAAGTYNWSVTVNSGGNIASGGSGTLVWDGSRFTSGTGQTVFTSTASTPPLQIAVDAPAAGTTAPTFAVTSKEGLFAGKFTAPKNLVTNTKVYDSLGNVHNVTTTASKTADNTWSWSSTVDGGSTIVGSGVLTYTDSGQLVLATGGPISFTPHGAAPVNISPDFSAVTQYASTTSEITSPAQDGFPMGQLQSYNIDSYGRIIGVFSNGMSQALAQIAVANFTNPAGLVRSGDTMFEESNNSGTAQIGTAGQGGRGLVTPGAVEMSNVDLSQEFTDMIVTQRGFQANSKIISTSDEMLQDLVNLKR